MVEMEQNEKAKSGRPTDFKEDYIEQGYRLCLLGLTDVQLADFWGCTEKTLNNWKNKHPLFLQSLNKGKIEADSKVAEALYNRARGYEYEEEDINYDDKGKIHFRRVSKKHMPGSVGAAAQWLHNRQRLLWGKEYNNDEKPPQVPPQVTINIQKEDINQ